MCSYDLLVIIKHPSRSVGNVTPVKPIAISNYLGITDKQFFIHTKRLSVMAKTISNSNCRYW